MFYCELATAAEAAHAAMRARAAERLREYRQARDLQRKFAIEYPIDAADYRRAALEYHGLAVILLQNLRLLGLA